MHPERLSVTLTYPDGAGITLDGQGAVVFLSGEENRRLFAVSGKMNLGDLAQLLSELQSAFGPDALALALSIACLSRYTGGEPAD